MKARYRPGRPEFIEWRGVVGKRWRRYRWGEFVYDVRELRGTETMRTFEVHLVDGEDWPQDAELIYLVLGEDPVQTWSWGGYSRSLPNTQLKRQVFVRQE